LAAPDHPGRLTTQGTAHIVERSAIITTRTALVGGGAQGIGRATAEALAGRSLHVIITGRREDALIATAAEITRRGGGQVDYLVSDLADPASAESALTGAEAIFGPPDVLVINAGGPPPGRILDIDDTAWRNAFELLVLGPLRLARLALPSMAKREFGRVIVVTSAMVRQPHPDLAISVVLRTAITSAVNLMSREYAADGVTVNCVAPGATDTDRRREVLANRARRSGADYVDVERADCADVPAGRAAEPAEIAAAIAFLASAEASFVNGTVLTVDGGRTETI
jgi:3-oxoacyl-[acyl-carrier protein] reductase